MRVFRIEHVYSDIGAGDFVTTVATFENAALACKVCDRLHNIVKTRTGRRYGLGDFDSFRVRTEEVNIEPDENMADLICLDILKEHFKGSSL